MLTRILGLFALIVIGLIAYIRLAPSDPQVWHVVPASEGAGDYPAADRFRAERVMTAPAAEVLQAVTDSALALPRTTLLAGSADEGLITFITRSQVIGFPDYTTVSVQGDLVVIFARLRFGKADLGVNAARVRHLLDAIGPLTQPL